MGASCRSYGREAAHGSDASCKGARHLSQASAYGRERNAVRCAVPCLAVCHASLQGAAAWRRRRRGATNRIVALRVASRVVVRVFRGDVGVVCREGGETGRSATPSPTRVLSPARPPRTRPASGLYGARRAVPSSIPTPVPVPSGPHAHAQWAQCAVKGPVYTGGCHLLQEVWRRALLVSQPWLLKRSHALCIVFDSSTKGFKQIYTPPSR